MADVQLYTFDYKEVVEELVKKQGLHEGLWALYIEFAIGAANVGESEEMMRPTAIVPLMKIGIQRAPKPNNLTVDAAAINPRPAADPPSPPSAPKPRKKATRA